MEEFSLIQKYFAQPNEQATQNNTALVLGIGDDCAIIRAQAEQDMVFSIDTMVAGVHFPKDAAAADIAWRLLGAAVSDLAAMGAVPSCFTLALTIPELQSVWLAEFSENLAAAANQYGITLAGGDTTKGPLTLSVQAHGFVSRGKALLRSTANVGDYICVSGSLGDSRAGLAQLAKKDFNSEQQYLLNRYYRPIPRISTGLFIKDYASACIDISDGLLADLHHILQKSAVSAQIDSQLLPLSAPLLSVAAESAIQWALSGGEDFELLFTVPSDKWHDFERASNDHAIAITKIGVVSTQDAGTSCCKLFINNQWVDAKAAGYNHFSN